MHCLLTRSVVLLCALALTACTTMNVVSDRGATPAQDPATLMKSMHVDDQVRITTLDSAVHALRLTAVSEAELTGVPEGSLVATSVPVGQIARIERREVAPGKTTLLVLGVIGTVVLVVLAAEAAAAAALLSGAH